MSVINAKVMTLEQELKRLETLTQSLMGALSVQEKNTLLDQTGAAEFIQTSPHLNAFAAGLELPSQIALKSVVVIGQGPTVLRIPETLEDKADHLRVLLGQLLEIDAFYNTIGGIVGYHTAVIRLLCHSEKPVAPARYLHPPGADFTSPSAETDRAVLWGLEGMDQLAEVYPVGGAGDRLGLVDPDTAGALPAACLNYGGRSLLESMVRDLAGREYLTFRLFGKRLVTPIALMTSEEKHNHLYISAICEEAHYFGRPKESFFLFTQCLVPQITEEGNWVVNAPLELSCKPGGHGALWKLMEDKGAFDWLQQAGRRKALVRQINNPVAGTDTTLLAFTGVGLKEDRAFGFCACDRKVGSAEGCNVLFERQEGAEWLYGLTNIEYTEFAKHGIEDAPAQEGSPFSQFPSNTNILFADLERVREATHAHPIPGMLINMKKKAKTLDADGQVLEKLAGRLESTMQNIADAIVTKSSKPLNPDEEAHLSSYLVYTDRQKTISVTKKTWCEGTDPHETPPGAYLDHLLNTHHLFSRLCHIRMPSPPEAHDVCCGIVPFHILYHPALGPLFSVIAQKIQGGSLAQGAELNLEVAELSWSNVNLDGSLRIMATNPLGEGESAGGKCLLHNCTIRNRGIDTEAENIYWQDAIKRHESCQIEIEGAGEFIAEGIVFEGAQKMVVPDGVRIRAKMEGGRVVFQKEACDPSKPLWNYSIGPNHTIRLKRLPSQPTP